MPGIKDKCVPKLRFPEFKNNGEWKVVRLGDIATCFSGGTPSATNKEYYGGDIPFIRSGELNSSKTALFLTRAGLDNSSAKIVEKGTILYALYGATSGEVGLAGVNGAINQAILAIIPQDTCDKLFLYYYLSFSKSTIVNKYLQGGQGNLSGSIITNLLIPFPCIKEQHAIASCLSSLDASISSSKAKLEQLKAHKKGLMQKLFPSPGKTLPEYRFPEFMNDGEWEVFNIEDLFVIRNGFTPSKSIPEFWERGTIPWFRIEDIRLNGHVLSDSIQHITLSAVKGAGLFPANSIIVATSVTIGEHALILVASLANQRFTVLTKRPSQDGRIDMMYFHQYMFIIDEWCKRNTNIGGLLSVNMPAFKRLKIPLPSINEQKAISSCLSSLDASIAASKTKLEQLITYQKGLMQKLFTPINPM